MIQIKYLATILTIISTSFHSFSTSRYEENYVFKLELDKFFLKKII